MCPCSSFLVLVADGSAPHFRVHHRNVSARWVGIDFHTSILQIPRISEYTQQHVAVPAFFLVSPLKNCDSTPLLLCCSRCVLSVLVLKPIEQPFHQFIASFCSGPSVLCGSKRICCPNAAICSLCLALDALVSRHTVAADVKRHLRQCLHVAQAVSTLSCRG